MISAIALDDEPPALKVLQSFCEKVDNIDLQKTFYKAEEALQYLKKYPVDLLFLDINMPAVSGIEFYKALPQKAMVIFTTAYSEYAVEGFNLNAVDYLLKPFTLERFLQAVQKAQQQYRHLHKEEVKQGYLLIRVDYSLVKIPFSDILFIEGLDDYLKIHIHHSKPVVVRMTMKMMVEKLPIDDFIRVHRSYIVPFRRIKAIRNRMILLEEEEIPIGSSYDADFFKLFNK